MIPATFNVCGNLGCEETGICSVLGALLKASTRWMRSFEMVTAPGNETVVITLPDILAGGVATMHFVPRSCDCQSGCELFR